MSADKERDQAIVDQAQKMLVVDTVKNYVADSCEKPLTLNSGGVNVVAEYILYLENQVENYSRGVENPPSPKQQDWIQKDIQIIMKDAGTNEFLEGAKIINLSGRVKIHRAEKDFIRATLDEAPDNMRFTLIEEMLRIEKQVVSAIASERNVTIAFDDGSTQIVPLAQQEKKEPSDDWE